MIIISFASIYGATRFDMTTKQLITYFIFAQLTSVLGALVFGYILDRIGAKKTISITILIWICVILGAFFSQSIKQYYMVGMLAGIAIGSSQSSSRTMLVLLTPDSKMAEFFGFYSFTGKMASIAGPLIYGEIARITGSQKFAIISVLFFFISGLIILQSVDEKKGKQIALDWVEN